MIWIRAYMQVAHASIRLETKPPLRDHAWSGGEKDCIDGVASTVQAISACFSCLDESVCSRAPHSSRIQNTVEHADADADADGQGQG
jgi:hypothetical protein